MPGYQVDVTDIGLSVEDAIGMSLERETFTRKRALPAALDHNAVEKQWFEGQPQGRNGWICQRVELNAMTAPQLVAYIEAALETGSPLCRSTNSGGSASGRSTNGPTPFS